MNSNWLLENTSHLIHLHFSRWQAHVQFICQPDIYRRKPSAPDPRLPYVPPHSLESPRTAETRFLHFFDASQIHCWHQEYTKRNTDKHKKTPTKSLRSPRTVCRNKQNVDRPRTLQICDFTKSVLRRSLCAPFANNHNTSLKHTQN